MERCVHKHLTNFFIKNNVITPYQSGFVGGDSTVNQLLYLSNDFSKALDEGREVRVVFCALDEEREVRVVFCDIIRAFDRVWHRG